MNSRSNKINPIKQLKRLAAYPDEQAAFATSLVQPKERHDVLLAALEVLADHPSEDAHDSLISVYQYLAENGTKRDSGAYVRSAALNALRPIARIQDTPLLLEAVETYEHLPPDFMEEASALRAAALLALNELDEEATSYHAARLLVDGQTAAMSAEPALTAVRVLASRNELVPLYQYVVQVSGQVIPEVSSECLRNLIALPESLVPRVITVVENRSSPVESLGLFDLLIGHESGPQGLAFVSSFLIDPHDLDVYRYVVLTVLMARKDELTRLICEVAREEADEIRRRILVEALEPFSTDERVRMTLEQMTGE